MTSYREALLGIPEQIQAGVDTALHAETRGPAAVDRALEHLSKETLRWWVRDLLGRYNRDTDPRISHRRAWADHARAEESTEQQQVRRGGNR